jgi:ABC-2 type transport system ATP-binding protein
MTKTVIETSGLTKFYGKVKGIENMDLEINEGEMFGFIGPNGAGKSTTIRILMNLLFPTSGVAKILGLDVVRETKQIKRRVGYIPSDANPYPSMSGHEFLSYSARFYDLSDGEERIKMLSESFELDLKRKISDLSVGNRKKVSIIQSMLHSPELLICDEPTTGLDPLMQSLFFDLIRSENKRGMTVFFSSHILSEVQMLCKRVAVIKEGKIITTEDIDSLRKKQLKKIYIEFGAKNDAEEFSLPGVAEIKPGTGNGLSFMFSGNMNDLVGRLSGKVLLNLLIEEPSLEEIFMHYYKQ